MEYESQPFLHVGDGERTTPVGAASKNGVWRRLSQCADSDRDNEASTFESCRGEKNTENVVTNQLPHLRSRPKLPADASWPRRSTDEEAAVLVVSHRRDVDCCSNSGGSGDSIGLDVGVVEQLLTSFSPTNERCTGLSPAAKKSFLGRLSIRNATKGDEAFAEAVPITNGGSRGQKLCSRIEVSPCSKEELGSQSADVVASVVGPSSIVKDTNLECCGSSRVCTTRSLASSLSGDSKGHHSHHRKRKGRCVSHSVSAYTVNEDSIPTALPAEAAPMHWMVGLEDGDLREGRGMRDSQEGCDGSACDPDTTCTAEANWGSSQGICEDVTASAGHGDTEVASGGSPDQCQGEKHHHRIDSGLSTGAFFETEEGRAIGTPLSKRLSGGGVRLPSLISSAVSCVDSVCDLGTPCTIASPTMSSTTASPLPSKDSSETLWVSTPLFSHMSSTETRSTVESSLDEQLSFEGSIFEVPPLQLTSAEGKLSSDIWQQQQEQSQRAGSGPEESPSESDVDRLGSASCTSIVLRNCEASRKLLKSVRCEGHFSECYELGDLGSSEDTLEHEVSREEVTGKEISGSKRPFDNSVEGSTTSQGDAETELDVIASREEWCGKTRDVLISKLHNVTLSPPPAPTTMRDKFECLSREAASSTPSWGCEGFPPLPYSRETTFDGVSVCATGSRASTVSIGIPTRHEVTRPSADWDSSAENSGRDCAAAGDLAKHESSGSSTVGGEDQGIRIVRRNQLCLPIVSRTAGVGASELEAVPCGDDGQAEQFVDVSATTTDPDSCCNMVSRSTMFDTSHSGEDVAVGASARAEANRGGRSCRTVPRQIMTSATSTEMRPPPPHLSAAQMRSVTADAATVKHVSKSVSCECPSQRVKERRGTWQGVADFDTSTRASEGSPSCNFAMVEPIDTWSVSSVRSTGLTVTSSCTTVRSPALGFFSPGFRAASVECPLTERDGTRLPSYSPYGGGSSGVLTTDSFEALLADATHLSSHDGPVERSAECSFYDLQAHAASPPPVLRSAARQSARGREHGAVKSWQASEDASARSQKANPRPARFQDGNQPAVTSLENADILPHGIFEDYILPRDLAGSLLGLGNFGRVVIAKHRVSEEECAIKSIAKSGRSTVEIPWDPKFTEVSWCAVYDTGPRQLCNSNRDCRRVIVLPALGAAERNEIEVMKRVAGHDCVMDLRGVYQDDRNVHLVMEYCRGGDLLQHLQQGGPITETKAKIVLHQVLSALEHVHARGVVHRDVKPENVVFCHPPESSLQIKLVDFGTAISWSEHEQLPTDRCGSPGYAAPEVFRGIPYSSKCDMWSVGVVLYAMLTGEHLNVAEAYAGNLKLSSLPPGLSEDCLQMLMALLSPCPQDRPVASAALKLPWLTNWVDY